MDAKKLSFLFASLLLITAGLGSGCSTVGGQPVINPQTAADAAVILRASARNAALLAIESDQNNKKYIQLSVAVLDGFLIGETYTPGALADALKPVIKGANDVKVSIAVNTLVDFYEVFYGRYVKNQVQSNEIAYQFIKAVYDGAAESLK
jgi:hypothetical protein